MNDRGFATYELRADGDIVGDHLGFVSAALDARRRALVLPGVMLTVRYAGELWAQYRAIGGGRLEVWVR